MALHQLKANEGARKLRTRVGRGIGSGLGKTSGRGILGQGSRSGGSVRPGFEGGQNPIYRRIPKRGFKNYTTVRYGVVNVGDLSQFKDGSEVNPTILIEKGLLKTGARGVKILGDGKLDKKLKVLAHHFSQSAIKAITEAGGTTEVIK
ncbi:MAG: 50S ribosomal protein L15 [Bacilli bacterium]